MAEVLIRLTDDRDGGGVAIDVGYTPAIAPDAKRGDVGLTAAQTLSLVIVDALRERGAEADGFVFTPPTGIGGKLPTTEELRERAIHPVCAACGATIQPGQDVTIDGPDFVEGEPRIISGDDVVIKHVECPPLGASE